jgi:nucleoside-diphosphate-sugar epimerase
MSLEHTLSKPALPDRTVVIGAAGFIGSTIVKQLRAEGADVVALTREDVDLSQPEAGARLAVRLKTGDAVVAAAAWAPCKDLSMLIANMMMVRVMLGAMRGVALSHVLNISSDAVYADEPLPLSETSPAAPTSMHGAMHLSRELAFASEVKAPLAILRPTLVYGAGDPHNGYGPNKFRRLANSGEEIVLFGEGEERRDHVLVDDVATLAVNLLRYRSRGILNAATGSVHSFKSVAEQAISASPRRVAISGRPRSDPMPHKGYRPFDPALALTSFPGFRFTDLATGIARAQAQEFA